MFDFSTTRIGLSLPLHFYAQHLSGAVVVIFLESDVCSTFSSSGFSSNQYFILFCESNVSVTWGGVGTVVQSVAQRYREHASWGCGLESRPVPGFLCYLALVVAKFVSFVSFLGCCAVVIFSVGGGCCSFLILLLSVRVFHFTASKCCVSLEHFLWNSGHSKWQDFEFVVNSQCFEFERIRHRPIRR